jgi:pimeloyl-ACP methyl ester carboxylesterase
MQTLRKISQQSFTEKTFSDNDFHFPSLVAGLDTGTKTVVIIHGVTGNKQDMVVVGREYLKNGYAVYIPDLPGHGASPVMEAARFSDLSDWLAAYIKATGAVPDVLMGNSFGSAICYSLAQRGLLGDSTHLILACPTPRIAFMTRLLRLAGDRLPEGWVSRQYNAPWAIRMRTLYLMLGRSKQARAWLEESEREKADFLNVKLADNFSMLLETDNPYDSVIPSSDVQRRMTIVIGEKDNVITPASVPLLKSQLQESTFVSVPGAGHILHFEAFKELAEVAKGEFIA